MMNCNSKMVVYLVTCTSCNIQYVGCTTRKLKRRISEHTSAVVNERQTNVSNAARHFIQVHDRDLSSLKVQGVEKVSPHPRGGTPTEGCYSERHGGFSIWIPVSLGASTIDGTSPYVFKNIILALHHFVIWKPPTHILTASL